MSRDSWQELALKRIYRRREETNRSDLPLLSVYRDLGVVERAGRDDNNNKPGEDLDAYRVVKPGDLVLNKMKTWQGSLGVSSHYGIVSPAYFVCRQIGVGDPRFFHHLLRSRHMIDKYAAHSKGIRPSQWDLPWDDFASFRVLLPSPKKQRAIADYLDQETARIDDLIEKKRRMVDLVNEKLVSVCETLLSSDGSEPVRLKHFVVKVGSGSTPRGGSDVYVDHGIAFLRSQNIKDGQVNHEDVVFISSEDDEILRRTRVETGDVLLNITGGSIGRTAIARMSDLPANVSQHVCIIRPNPSVSSELLQAALDSSNVQEQIDLMQVGGNREGLNFEQIRNLMIVLPSSHMAAKIEQNLIAERLRLKRVKESLLKQIDLFVIRRQVLITAAVTGEIEIPEVAA